MKIIYRNVPYNQPGQVPGTVVIDDSMPEWNQKQWLLALAAFTPDPPIYEPTFIDAFVSVPDGMGGTIRQQIGAGEPESFNSLFATRETAVEMAKRFGWTPEVVSIDPGYGNVVMEPATAYGIELKDGRRMNAGVLASVYVRLNTTGNQQMADQFIKTLIDSKIGWPVGGTK